MSNQLITYTEAKTAGGIFFRKTFTDPELAPLVLVMGYGGSLRVWPPAFVNKLAERYTVITYDNRGTGLSIIPRDEQDYTIAKMAGDLNEVMETLSLTSCHLLGYSMGSCIALQYASTYLEKVKTLFILSGTAGGALYAKPAPELSAALARPEGQTLWDMYVSTWKLMYSPEAMQRCEAELKVIYENSKDLPTKPFVLQGHSHAFRNFDATGFLARITVPTTVLSGKDDRLMPVKNSLNLAEALPNARLVLIPGCEHAPHVQEEALVVKEIEEFCR